MRLFLLCLLLLSLSVANFADEVISGDFDNDGQITLKDIAYYMAWISKNRTSNINTVLAEAERLYPSANGPLVRLPDASYDGFAGEAVLGLSDIAIMMGWLSKNRNSSFQVVLSQAKSLYSRVSIIYKLPGTPIGDSSFTTTIDGIVADK